ncbi:MAG: tryptophan--tRNA ligase [Vulcanimicrobiaceae bacterium]
MDTSTGSQVVQANAGGALRIMSGTRPTGKLHLGHLVGVLLPWAELSRRAECFFEVADLHALTTAYERTAELAGSVFELVATMLAVGVDGERAAIYVQSRIAEIPELHLLLSMIVPVSWLQRVPTYKDQLEALGPEIATYGFLGYPLMQLVDIAVVRANAVPVGKDQLSHLEFGREVVRRFNHLYGATLVEPQSLLSEFPDVPGTDGRKMSKSYGNTIDIVASDDETTARVRSMLTDPQKIRRGDPGRPEICPVFALQKIVNAERTGEIERDCRSGALGCVACKGELASTLNDYLRPFRERRAAVEPAQVAAVLASGQERARAAAALTLAEVRAAIGLGRYSE